MVFILNRSTQDVAPTADRSSACCTFSAAAELFSNVSVVGARYCGKSPGTYASTQLFTLCSNLHTPRHAHKRLVLACQRLFEPLDLEFVVFHLRA